MIGIMISGGSVEHAFAVSVLENHKKDKLIAVDAGLELLKDLELIPDVIVGDFDTVKPEVLEWYRQYPYIIWKRHQPEKDYTDTELALEAAVQMGCDKVILLGATGGRLDHELANIHLVYHCHQQGTEVEILDPKNRITVLSEGRRFQQDKLYGTYVSFLPLTDQVTGITLRGFKYPLTDRDIAVGTNAGLCISNEVVEPEAFIEFKDGILICIESHD